MKNRDNPPQEHMPDFVPETYLRHIRDIRKVAKAMGYAIGVHGSLYRDIDLIAVPWTENATTAADLAEQIRQMVGGHFSHSLAGQHLMADKPHGRMGCCINVGNGVYFDLSIVPLQQAARIAELEREREELRALVEKVRKTIRSYDAVFNALPIGQVRVVIGNALPAAYNGASEAELREQLKGVVVTDRKDGGV